MGRSQSGRSTSEQRADGAVESEQRIPAPGPVVEDTERGAAELGAVYWREVERFMRGLVRVRVSGGLLTRSASGTISFMQEAGPPPALASAISGFFPRFAAAPGRPSWTGAFYEHVQRRLHLAVSRRYFKALVGGSQR